MISAQEINLLAAMIQRAGVNQVEIYAINIILAKLYDIVAKEELTLKRVEEDK